MIYVIALIYVDPLARARTARDSSDSKVTPRNLVGRRNGDLKSSHKKVLARPMGYLALVLLLFWSCVGAPRVVVAKTPDVSATAGLRESTTTSLGDGSTTAESTRDLMQEVDTNNDGDISRTEVRQYINHTGGEALDRRDKVVHAAGLSFDAMDGNGDRDLTKLELNDYWRSVANFLAGGCFCSASRSASAKPCLAAAV